MTNRAWTLSREPEWRAVCGYEGRYEVSDMGQIRSLFYDPPRLMSPFLNEDGYPRIRLMKDGKLRGFRLHRLICEAFHGPGNVLHNEVAHLDGNRANARADNLKWVSKSENYSHRYLHGTDHTGERHPRAKLCEADVREILTSRKPYKVLAEKFGVGWHAICDVKTRKRWRHVSMDQG